MIALNPSEAEDIINKQFLTNFRTAETLALIGYQPEILWAGNEKSKAPNANKYYVRVSNQTVLEEQASISSCVGVNGQKRFRISGLTFVQLFCPLVDPKVRETGKKLATIARNAFRGASAHSDQDTVWFRNARINDNLPVENDIYRLNVVAEHEYDELG